MGEGGHGVSLNACCVGAKAVRQGTAAADLPALHDLPPHFAHYCRIHLCLHTTHACCALASPP